LAGTHSVLNEKNEAFEFLETAYQERVGLLIFLDAYPTFDNIRSDPRYADLLRRMGLPQLRPPTSPS
jgi:CRISPR/Cas system CMR subunit Cmr6 (Cas7 group RAMP superfamily)